MAGVMTGAMAPTLDIRPLTPTRMDDLRTVLRGTWGASCWCLFPRLTAEQTRALPGDGPLGPRLRMAMAERAAHPPAPGLLAYAEGAPVGWVAIAPRSEFARVDASRATPQVDNIDVWVIPCLTVRKDARGRGVSLALITAAVDFAWQYGAPAVEAYVRAGDARTSNDSAFFGTEPMFRQAGFAVVRGPLPDLPRNWTPRVTMRIGHGESTQRSQSRA